MSGIDNQAMAIDLEQSIQTARDRLDSVDAARFDRLDFVWEGIQFSVSSAAPDSAGPNISLDANLGRLYFTVEDEFERGAALERIADTNRRCDGKYRISRNGKVSFSNLTATDEKLLGPELVSATTLILLEAGSHLRALRSHLKASA